MKISPYPCDNCIIRLTVRWVVAGQDRPGERTVVLAGDARSVRPSGPVEDDLLVGRAGLGEDRVVVGGVEITPDVGEAGGDVVVLQLVL